MRKALCILLAATFLLCGCGKAKEPGNPYRLKQQILERYQGEETQTTRTEYIYDENGWLVETQTFHDDEWWFTTKFTRDASGNMLDSKSDYADGTQTEEVVLTMDDQGRMLTSESYLNGALDTTTECAYNGDGQITKRYSTYIDILNDEDWISYADMTYDRKGNLIREDIRWEPNDNNSYTLFSYEKDRLIREERYSRGQLDSCTEYTFDEIELVQTAIAKKGQTFVQSKHITTYDEYGNPLEVLAFAYGSEFARLGKTDEEPDSRTTYVYELKNPNP